MAEFVIHETDERMFFLKKELDSLKPKNQVDVFAPNIVIEPHLLKDVAHTVVGGRLSDDGAQYVKEHNIIHRNLLIDEDFQASNAALTAQGTLGVILSHSMLALEELDVLIIGFGRTGAATAKLLAPLVNSLAIATTASPRPAHAFGKVVATSSFDFRKYNVIINTVPSPVISNKDVLTINFDAVYIDLASAPALSLDFAKFLGLDADIYPALPAKSAPRSAAKAIKKYIMENCYE